MPRNAEPRYDLPRAAPEPLRTLQRFVNSVDLEHEREWLRTPADLSNLLADLSLDAGDATPLELERALALREALRALLRATTGDAPPPPEALAVVNRISSDGRLTVEYDERGRVRFVPGAAGVPGALAALVAIAAAATLDGSAARLKACRNCGWAFYDSSRNRTAGWCSMALCGNRQKTRRYRARKATRGS